MHDYIQLALRTESTQWNEPDPRLLHAAMGMVTESVELLNHTDEKNLLEELGDILWYVAIACDTLGVTIDEALDTAGGEIDESHSAEGLVTFSAEVLDTLKKNIFYRKPIDFLKIVRLLGTIILEVDGISGRCLGDVMGANIVKLEKRFPELKFTREAALHRNVKHEISHL